MGRCHWQGVPVPLWHSESTESTQPEWVLPGSESQLAPSPGSAKPTLGAPAQPRLGAPGHWPGTPS